MMPAKELQKEHDNVFLSLSTAINERSPNHRALITVCANDRLLVESDYPDLNECAGRTWDMVIIVAEIKGWRIEEDWIDDLEMEKWGAIRKLEANWRGFRKVSNGYLP